MRAVNKVVVVVVQDNNGKFGNYISTLENRQIFIR